MKKKNENQVSYWPLTTLFDLTSPGQRGQQGRVAPAGQVAPAGAVGVGRLPPIKPPHRSTPAQIRVPPTLVQDQIQSESKAVGKELVGVTLPHRTAKNIFTSFSSFPIFTSLLSHSLFTSFLLILVHPPFFPTFPFKIFLHGLFSKVLPTNSFFLCFSSFTLCHSEIPGILSLPTLNVSSFFSLLIFFTFSTFT